MYTINQFETTLLANQVQIEEITSDGKKVIKAIGYKDRKRLTWDESGKCFFSKSRMPENDLKFNSTIKDHEPET